MSGHVNNWGDTALTYASREGQVEIMRLLTRTILLERVRERRYKMFKTLYVWQQSVDIGKPGSNVFFYNMDQVMGHPCTFEELREDYPDYSKQNHMF